MRRMTTLTTGLAIALAATLAPQRAAEANGDVLLSLPANPSTGYAWILNEDQSTGVDLVEIEDRGYGPPESDLIGAPAPALFAVTCTGPGEVRLVFDYVSPSGETVSETRAVALSCD